ncbi:MAG: radical SAM protein [Humidesulfovibrio sp.]|uniref:B12-binding domain-containing radical SAM protein n=1 Tax=Humidesulfovibrio sp. TaxID=2910988 RepID=UPI0027FFD121|nr:radical SAM protein [Humidesulfovibrio sp.]MDQ7834332.1 radical SAM protein [Humidesulfovibrio sp.]
MKIKRALFVSLPTFHPEDYDYAFAKRRAIPLYPPIAPALLAASTRQLFSAELENRIFDYDFEVVKGLLASRQKLGPIEDLLVPVLQEFKPDVVNISFNFGLSTEHVLGITEKIRAVMPDVVICAGGNHATLYYEDIMRYVKRIDYIVRYEGDRTMAEFYEHLEGARLLSDVSGLCYRDGEAIVCNEYAAYPTDLDTLPLPAWELTSFDTYHTFGRIGSVFNYGDPNLPTYTMYTSRGCGGNCKFCTSKAFNGAKVRFRSADSMLAEIEEAYHRYGIKQFEILDDDFTYNRARVIEFAEKLAARKYDIKWNLLNGIRLITLDDEVVGKMIDSGLRLISVGIEACHPEIMRKIRKQLTVEILYEKMALLNRYPELYVKGNFIFGFPYETWEHIEETARVARELTLDWYIFSIFTPLPNTPLFKEIQERIPDFSSKYLLNEFKLDVYEMSGTQRKHYDYLKELSGITLHEMTAYITQRNLELNFVRNKNLQGRDVARAVRDFEGVVTFIKPDHAIAHYCLAQGYASLDQAEKSREHADAFRRICAEDATWLASARELGLTV